VATIRSNGARSGAPWTPSRQQHADPGIAGQGQQPPGLGDHVVQDVDGHHQALVAHQLGHERGVVAGARADLENPESGGEV
jgi:hypothetical protein